MVKNPLKTEKTGRFTIHNLKGSSGYDNPRENIDPQIKTKVLYTQEARIGGNFTQTDRSIAPLMIKSGKDGAQGIILEGTRTGGRSDIAWYDESGTALAKISAHDSDDPGSTERHWQVYTPDSNENFTSRFVILSGLNDTRVSISSGYLRISRKADSVFNEYALDIRSENSGAGLGHGILIAPTSGARSINTYGDIYLNSGAGIQVTGLISGANLTAQNGLTGSGAYTNFQFSGGICITAS